MKTIWNSDVLHDRFDGVSGQQTMKAIVTEGNGGYEKLLCREVCLPVLKSGEVLVHVLAAGVNNTEINTRLGWYSSSVITGTEDAVYSHKTKTKQKDDGGWNDATPFPFIQGTDCCGLIHAVASDGDTASIGVRVLIRPCMHLYGFQSRENIWMGSDFDGSFAQFVKVPATEVFPIHCDWTDAELGTIPCAYGTAENMVHRAKICKGYQVLVAGASGGVGSAVVQLVKRRGATVIAIAGKTKQQAVLSLGADRVFDRHENMRDILGENSVDVVIDNVAGPNFSQMIKILKRGGRYVSSGAIGGPLVNFDMRDFYLKDLTFIGCTGWDEVVFPHLISYIERGEIRPLVAKVFPLAHIVDAQKEFLQKKYVGNFVLIPPALDDH